MTKVFFGICLSAFGALCLNSALVQANPVPTAPTVPSQTNPSANPSNPSNEQMNPAGNPAQPPAGNSTPPASSTPTNPGTETSPAEEYTKLQEYIELAEALKGKDWEAADDATYRLLLKLAGETSVQTGRIDMDEWKNVSCSAFNSIDSLWKEASDGKQGFSAQWEMFAGVSSRNQETYYYSIGWRDTSGTWKVAWGEDSNGDITYLLNREPNFVDPPSGHLPARLEWEDGNDYRFNKRQACLSERGAN
jgi:hypothetical protein